MLIDHLVYAAPDLQAAVASMEKLLGVRACAGGRHTGQGTHNALLSLSSQTYLEILAPDPGQPRPPESLPFGIEGISRGQLVAWALACDDIDAAITRARAAGYDPGQASDGYRSTPAGTLLQWRGTAIPGDDGLVPFLISWGGTEHPARSAPAGLALEAFYLEHPDPSSLRPSLAALGTDVEVRPAAEAALVACLSGPHGRVVLR